jgi:peroxiredoxin
VRVVVRVLILLMFALMLAGPIEALQVGDKAPDFALNGPDGKPVKLADLTAKGPVVLYTFVAAFTPT